MSVKSIRHKKNKRSHIPSREEAGSEAASPAVRKGPERAEFPLNPVVHRGQDPELFWLGKHGAEDEEERLQVDLRSLYRHAHIAPETLIEGLYRRAEGRETQEDLLDELFGHALERDELEKVSDYYRHQDGWTNRMILGDSLMVMTSLLQREGMAGQVQCIYIDPPYGIKYGSNWQMRIGNRTVRDGDDRDLTGEPEQIKAYRDTWELGIHSYLSYLRDRLLVSKELLTESGSCFVQISDENVHLVRCLMDEVFGSENFIGQIVFRKTTTKAGDLLPSTNDFLLWYCRDNATVKHRSLFWPRSGTQWVNYDYVSTPDGEFRKMTPSEKADTTQLPEGAKVYRRSPLTSTSRSASTSMTVEFEGQKFTPGPGGWKTNTAGFERLKQQDRLESYGKTLSYRRYVDDFPFFPISDTWTDTASGGYGDDKLYTVQTTRKVIQRCILYKPEEEQSHDVRQGFVYEQIPHIKLETIAHDDSPEQITLYDKPYEDRKKLRVSGPFTVETLQSFDPVPPEELDEQRQTGELADFEELIFEYLRHSGVKNGLKGETAVFTRVDRLHDANLHAEGFYPSADGERKAYLHIGPKFGSVSRRAVNEAVKACRARGDADWLIVLGFHFESGIESGSVTTSAGTFEVTRTRMHDDLIQEGLLKRDKKAAAFVTIGEPDIGLCDTDPADDGSSQVLVEIRGLDLYDPIADEVKPRDVHEIAYWMVDSDYDGSNFVARQIFFCGGDKKEYDKWRKGLERLAADSARKRAEKTLRIEIDEDAFDRLYGHVSHPIPVGEGRRIAVRVISQFGEESTKVLQLEGSGS